MKKRILVVDDEEKVREMYGEILFKEGYEVELAKNGEEAINKLKKGRFDLVLSENLKMAEGDNLFLEELRSLQRMGEIPRRLWVIVTTAKERDLGVLIRLTIATTAKERDPDVLSRLLNVWVNGFIPKPSRIEKIRDVVGKGLEDLDIWFGAPLEEMPIGEEEKRRNEDYEWIAENIKGLQGEYEGKWIAVVNKKVVGSGGTLSEAEEGAKINEPDKEPILNMVPKKGLQA